MRALKQRPKQHWLPFKCVASIHVLISSIAISMAGSGETDPLSLDSLYKTFNLRTIYSMRGQTLKYDCNTYLSDYFAPDKVRIDKDRKTMELLSGDTYWSVSILDEQQIALVNQALEGTYNTYAEYELTYISSEGEWVAGPILIPKMDHCSLDAANGTPAVGK